MIAGIVFEIDNFDILKKKVEVAGWSYCGTIFIIEVFVKEVKVER